VAVFAIGFWALQRAQLGGDPNDPATVRPLALHGTLYAESAEGCYFKQFACFMKPL
jgi:hypothetical protein